jgi:YD repeat-containing protein
VTSINDQNLATRTVETVDRTTATVTRITTFPGVSNEEIEISTNGRMISRQTPGANAPVTYQYDGLSRLWKTTDPRTATVVETRLYHPGTDQLASIATPAGTTEYVWYPPAHANAGQLAATTNPDNTVVRQTYNPRGHPVRTRGSASYPVEWTFDGYGQMTAMRTFQTEQGWDGTAWPASVTGGSLTQWHYHEPSGVLDAKEDAASESVTYSRTVTGSGTTQTRTWARTPGAAALTTTWTHDLAGNLTTVTYSDATPPVTITSDRAGRPAIIADAAGTRSLTHSTAGQLEGEVYTGGLLSDLSFSRGHDAQSRLGALTWTQGAASLVSQSYTYSPSTGRLNTAVDGPVSVTNRYIPNSDLDQGPEFRHNGNLRMTTTRTYDAASRLLGIASTRPGSPAHSSTAYQFDSASRRKKATAADGTAWDYNYNDRGELHTAARKWRGGSASSG